MNDTTETTETAETAAPEAPARLPKITRAPDDARDDLYSDVRLTTQAERRAHLRTIHLKASNRDARRICLMPPEQRPQRGHTPRGKVKP